MTELLITVPVYNEAKRIKENTIEIINFFDRKDVDYTIALAVDPSEDNSVELCRELERTNPKVVTLVSKSRKGRGVAVRNSWRTFDADVYSFIDADLSPGLVSLYEGFRLIKEENEEFVIGSRYSDGSMTERPPLRKTVSFAYNKVIQILFQNEIKDYQCGLKIVSKLARDEVIEKSKVNSWFWDTEIVIIALMNGVHVYQLPVQWKELKYRHTSIKRLFKDIILHGWGLILLYKRAVNSDTVSQINSNDDIYDSR